MTNLTEAALLQLAQYQPHRDGGATREEMFRQMVCPVLMEAGGRVAGPADIKEAFETLFGVEIEDQELRTWLTHLESIGAVTTEQNTIAVTDQARKLLEDAKQAEEVLAAAARREWRSTLISQDPELKDDELTELESDLDQLIASVVAYHGAEAAVILFPEQERSEALRETLRSKAEALPRREERLEGLRRAGLEQFFQAPTENQRRYLAGRLDFGFFATVGTLRPEGAAVIREELANQRMYLDTNVLIGALGLAGRETNESIKRLLDLSRGLGVSLAVTSRTLEEFRHSLDRAREQIVSRGLPSRRYAGVLRDAARELGGISLTEGYFESYGAVGSSPEDWFRRAAQFEPMLDDLGIAIDDEGLDAVLKTEGSRINDYVVLLGREASFRAGRPRDDLPMQHDAIHRALIERLRGRSNRRFGTAQYWFLTEDKVLPRFGQLAVEGERVPTVPFCMSGAAWRQIARCLTPRTDDFDQTITDLLASPYLRFGKARDLGEVQRAVARISTILGDDASPAVVAAAVKDETLEAVAAAGSDEAMDDVLVNAYRQSEDEIAERLDRLNARVEANEVELAEERKRKSLTAAEATASEAANADLQRTIEEKEREIREGREALARERSAGAEEIERLRAKEKKEKADAERRRASRKRNASLGTAALVLLIAVGLLVFGVISVGAALIGGATVIAFLVAPFIEHSRWAWRVGFVLAVLGVVVGLLPLLA